MRGKCVIISGGRFSPLPDFSDADFVIACDRGYSYTKTAGILPDLVIGDFDSCPEKVDAKIPTARYPREKDDTDTMLAVKYAVTHEYAEIILLCVLGGRFDHTYANLQAAAYAAQHGVSVTLSDDQTIIHVMNGGTLRLPRQDDRSVSLFSFTNTCSGVTTRGLKYPLRDAGLTNTFPIGISNEWADDCAEISVNDGLLLIVLSSLED